jgi:precorrin-2 dehydrogenase/sirohydrochlorin ferrochelatase
VTAPLYPLFLKLRSRDVLVVGAGRVAARKILDLVTTGARVRVVGPRATPAIAELAKRGDVTLRARRFETSDLDGAWLVVVATDDARLQGRIARACEARRVFVLAVDDPSRSTAYSGSIVRRGSYTVALSSSGATPALTRLLRELLEQILPEERWVEAARRLRRAWRREGRAMDSRFGELVRAFRDATPPRAEPEPRARPGRGSPPRGRRPRRR